MPQTTTATQELTPFPFELPGHLVGCEELIIDMANREAQRLINYTEVESPDMNSIYRCVAAELDDKVRSYWALGQIATNPNSLSYQLYKGTPKLESWSPWA